MKALLMLPDRDFDLRPDLPAHAGALTADLGLDRLVDEMARGDKLVWEASKRALVMGLTDVEDVRYRQGVLVDCLEHAGVVEELYDLAVQAVEAEKKIWGLYLVSSPRLVLSRGQRALQVFLGYLRRLRRLRDEHADEFSSVGFGRFFKMVADELDDAYLAEVEGNLERAKFRGGLLVSAGLGPGLSAADLVLHRRPGRGLRDWWGALRASGDSFEISTRDEAGLKILDELEARALNEVANALAQSAEHVRSFFSALARELAFYIGCINLRRRLAELGQPACMPEPRPLGELSWSGEGIYDVVLALRSGQGVVGNELRADGKDLVVVTGANQGGKSTFLRSLGLAQLMMQAGMFVSARRFRASLCKKVFTHFKREEDVDLKGGKLDEELRRMSVIADATSAGSLLLCNESFATTNEREGSELGLEVVRAMTSSGVKVAYVTHLFELARRLGEEAAGHAVFLRAPRQGVSERFKLVEGAPEPTAYGEDLYRKIFGPMAERLVGLS
jgi:hypothetical protein